MAASGPWHIEQAEFRMETAQSDNAQMPGSSMALWELAFAAVHALIAIATELEWANAHRRE